MNVRTDSRELEGAAVTLLAEATDSGVSVAAAVSNGVANGMELGLDPATRLNAIVVEACGNVVQHAYGGRAPGTLELSFFAEPLVGDPGMPARVHSRIRDFGNGMEFLPTSADPPGLGLSVICNLADEMTIRSEPLGGTSVEASVLVLEEMDSRREAALRLPHGSCELRFGDLGLAEAVLPRALVAHARGPQVTLNQVTETMLVGVTLARAIEGTCDPTPTVRISRHKEDSGLRVKLGPLASADASALLGEIDSSWWGRDPGLSVTVEAGDEGHEFALVDVPGPYA